MNAIDVTGLTKSYGTTTILSSVSFAVGERERVGIVGRNGCGKSTLFRILAGREEADSGEIVKRRGLTMGYLDQRPGLDPGLTVRQLLGEYLGEPRENLKRHGELSRLVANASGDELDKLLKEQEEVHSWLDHHNAWTLDHRVEEICARFNILNPDAKVADLSGGWNQRVALAGMLLAAPDLLLLDEPTNQLDADTVAWLEEYLLEYPGAILLVTHDRYFLDRVVTRMFELEGGELTAYTGGYSSYLEQKAERLTLEGRTQSRLLNLLRREEEWLSRSPKARTTKQKARIGRAEELREKTKATHRRELDFAITTGREAGGMVLEAEKITAGYGGNPIIRDFSLTLRKGERIGVLGPNGCGKSTLIKALLGELPLISGEVRRGNKTLIGYIDQERSGLMEEDSVEENLSLNEWVTVGGARGERKHRKGYLESFLFSYNDQKAPVSTLSGGERARLLLAKLLLIGANLIVLDEPTNDIDIPTLQVLDEALTEFTGSALIVTHDRYFLDKVATGILHMEGDGRVTYYEGGYTAFSRAMERKKETERESQKRAAETKAAKGSQQPAPATVKKKGLSFKEKKELEEIEEKIALLEERHGEVEASLAAPASIDGGHEALTALSEELSKVGSELETLMERWEELESKK
ncbi:MAG: ABC transporter [Deltaproteobacteria bacterium]|nr:MAG: ABC transporter [Deltaproteobacteria bacterium]